MIDVVGMRAVVVHTYVLVIPIHIVLQVDGQQRALDPTLTEDLGLSRVTQLREVTLIDLEVSSDCSHHDKYTLI